MSDNLDDYDFTPSSSSNLRSLFDTSTHNSESSSLTYTAPKQPKLTTGTEPKMESVKTETSVIYACVVQVWKLIDGKYIAIGKHGCAIIGSSTQTSYEMILYKEKQNVIMRSKVGPNFEFCSKKDDFASFYDATKNNWLIKFNSGEDCMKVVNYIEEYGGRVKSNENIISTTEKSEDVKTVDEMNPDNKIKSDILTRIAKMGQPILPTKSSEFEENAIDTSDSNIPKNRENPVKSLVEATSIIQTVPTIQSVPNTFVMSPQAVSYDPFNVYVAENRAHGSEVRMNLSQISEKLNCIMKLVESPKATNEPDSSVLKSKVKVLELRTDNLLKELSSVQEENANLKLQMNDQNKAASNEEMFKAEMKQLQETIQESEMKIIALKDENTKITQTHNTEIEKLKKELEAAQDDTKWTGEIKRLEEELSALQEKLTECDQSMKKKSALEDTEKERSAKFTALLKEEMNGMYASIGSNLNDQLNMGEIHSTIAQNIKSTTLKIIQNFQQLYDSQ